MGRNVRSPLGPLGPIWEAAIRADTRLCRRLGAGVGTRGAWKRPLFERPQKLRDQLAAVVGPAVGAAVVGDLTEDAVAELVVRAALVAQAPGLRRLQLHGERVEDLLLHRLHACGRRGAAVAHGLEVARGLPLLEAVGDPADVDLGGGS